MTFEWHKKLLQKWVWKELPWTPPNPDVPEQIGMLTPSTVHLGCGAKL